MSSLKVKDLYKSIGRRAVACFFLYKKKYLNYSEGISVAA